ncbi:MAG TPA: protocatechuate 3,4-dioxygenase subunit alpha [Rugosimonospora sp.]|nr:protocatechuate 3,4-dioxygenase subunit alpha [Rugosimonospora sp.]
MPTEPAPAGLTPSQTVGPFLHIGLPWDDGDLVCAPSVPGSFVLSGRVLDGAGQPVPDALVEVWQADPAGRFAHPDDPRGPADPPAGFRGFGRCPTDDNGEYRFRTVKPGCLPTADGRVEAPHLDLSIFARGLLDRLVTRVYFAGEPGNAQDPVLAGLPDPERRDTLLAVPVAGGYVFDIRLQGERETVFFDV